MSNTVIFANKLGNKQKYIDYVISNNDLVGRWLKFNDYEGICISHNDNKVNCFIVSMKMIKSYNVSEIINVGEFIKQND